MSTLSNSPLRQRMIEDMNARKLTAGTQTGHLRACRRFAAFLKRSPDTVDAEDIRESRRQGSSVVGERHELSRSRGAIGGLLARRVRHCQQRNAAGVRSPIDVASGSAAAARLVAGSGSGVSYS